MTKISSVCIFCGSRNGYHSQYTQLAQELGFALVNADKKLIYGGGQMGLMGTFARSVLSSGGHITGIIPQFLNTEDIRFDDISEIIITQTLAERMQKMAMKADAFISLPGGTGTLEELIQMMMLNQLQQQNKPIILLNYQGFWQPFIDMLNHFEQNGFLYPQILTQLHIANNIEETLAFVS